MQCLSTRKTNSTDRWSHIAKWLIIGGAGFIGSHLVEYLITHGSDEVTVSDVVSPNNAVNIAPFLDSVEYEWKSVHDHSPSDFLGYDYVVYCAAQADAPLALSSPRYTFQQNVMGVLHVLETLRNVEDRPRLIYLSSEDVYGAVPHDRIPIVEDEPLRPVNPYGVSKAAADLLCQSYARTFGIPVIVLRSSSIFGPRARGSQVIPIFIRNALKNKNIIVEGDGSQAKDFNYVLNLVEAILLSAKNGKTGEVYNIGSGEEISIISLAREIVRATGSSSEITFRPWRVGERGLRLVMSIAKARKDLGYVPKVTFREGIRRTIDWIRLKSQS